MTPTTQAGPRRGRGSVLVTSSRMPFAVDEIRKLGGSGFTVYAADTFPTAPGQHSRHATRALVLPSPRKQPREYVRRVAELARELELERLIPTFEEVFYLAKLRDQLGPGLELFAPAFDTLATLHHKHRFLRLAEHVGMSVSPLVAAQSRSELADALRRFDGHFARPAFSRGGQRLLTNRGPRAGALDLDDCNPTPENPWVVQPYIEGEDVCTFGVAHHGRLLAHVSYVHPHTIDDGGGILFESIDDPELVEQVRRLVEATGYHGQISLDFRRTDDGIVVLECNPRATAGVALMPTADFVDALEGRTPGRLPAVTPAGERRKIGAALIRDMLLHWREIPDKLRAFVSGGDDLFAVPGDRLPGLYQLVSYLHIARHRHEIDDGNHTPRVAAYMHDISWDGEAIP